MLAIPRQTPVQGCTERPAGIHPMPQAPPPGLLPKKSPSIMHIKKQRLLTPGPTLSIRRLCGRMRRRTFTIRTEDFRTVYKAVLADLKRGMEPRTTAAVRLLRTGAMEASVSNLFSGRGDRSSCAQTGVRRTLGGNHQSVRPGGQRPQYRIMGVVTPERVEPHWPQRPIQRRFRAGFRDLDRRGA